MDITGSLSMIAEYKSIITLENSACQIND